MASTSSSIWAKASLEVVECSAGFCDFSQGSMPQVPEAPLPSPNRNGCGYDECDGPCHVSCLLSLPTAVLWVRPVARNLGCMKGSFRKRSRHSSASEHLNQNL